jgi:hypothetical protein
MQYRVSKHRRPVFSIPRTAPHKALAEAFISYFHRRDVAALFVSDSGF